MISQNCVKNNVEWDGCIIQTSKELKLKLCDGWGKIIQKNKTMNFSEHFGIGD